MTVSVLIPSFNHARYLPACLDSLRSQTFADWEAILVDDGSSDESVAIASAAAHEDARIQVLTNEANLGTYGTQQRALDHAAGARIAILNSDDLWAPEKLEVLNGLLDRHPEAAFAYALGAWIDEDGRPYRTQLQHAD